MARLVRRPSLYVFLGMLLVLLLFTFPLWSADRVLFMGDITTSDITELNFPARYILSTALRGGSIPAWNPYIGCGFPSLAEGQSGLLYPLNLLLFRLLGPAAAFNASVILSLFLCLVFSYLLLRLYGLSRGASFYGAVAFTFSGFVVSKIKFTYMVNSIPWVPLSVYGLEKTFLRRDLRFFLLTTLALAMQILAGGPQILFINLLLLLLTFCWRFVPFLRWNLKLGGNWKRATAWLAVGFLLSILLGLALGAPQLLPQAAGFPYFNRAQAGDFGSILATPMRPISLSLFFSPYQHGNPAYGTFDLSRWIFWEDIAYPGLLSMVLALVAVLFLVHRDREVGMWLTASLLALLVALGHNTPLAEFLYRHVPGFDMFRFYQRFMLITVLGVAVLAGKGLDLVIARIRARGWGRSCLVSLMVLILLLDLGMFAHAQISTIEARALTTPGGTAEFLRGRLDGTGEYRYSTLGEDEVWKAAYRQARGWMGDKSPYYAYFDFLPPNTNTIFEIPGVHQYGAYGLTPIKMLWGLTYYGEVPEGSWKRDLPEGVLGTLALQSARYIVTPYILEEEGLKQVASLPTGLRGVDLHLYELEYALPRVMIFNRYQVVEDPGSLTLPQLDDLLTPTSDLRERVILEEEPAPVFAAGSPARGEAHIVQSDPCRVVVEADVPEGGILVLNDAYYPEWETRVDGAKREVLRANLAFRAVVLEPGHHTVEFTFRPLPMYYGLFLALAALALIALLLLRHRQRGWLFV